MYGVGRAIVEETFEVFRRCGRGQRECQAYWVSEWTNPWHITRVVHPHHDANACGFQVHDEWLNRFLRDLGVEGLGVRLQVHTHPGAAYHSHIDDRYPLLAHEGFLSLVIPNFGMGPISFEDAFLAEIQRDGCWRPVEISGRIRTE